MLSDKKQKALRFLTSFGMTKGAKRNEESNPKPLKGV